MMEESSVEEVKSVWVALQLFNSKTPQAEGFRLAGNSTTLRLAQFNDLIKLRGLGSAGGGYMGTASKLCAWVLQMRLLELPAEMKFSFFEVDYFSNWDNFVETTQDLGIELDTADFTAHKTDLDAREKLFTVVWETQWEGLNSELGSLPPPQSSAVVVTQLEPSHPEGWGAGALALWGRFRIAQERHRNGERATALPREAQELIGRVLFHISKVDKRTSDPGWPLLQEGSQLVLASATFAGIQENTPIGSLTIQGFDLAQPFLGFTLAASAVKELKTVEDASEAWQLYSQDPTQCIFLTTLPAITADRPGAWPTSVIDRDGNSLVAGSAVQGELKPDLKAICKLAGVVEGDSMTTQKMLLARMFAQTTASQVGNIGDNKGSTHGAMEAIRASDLAAEADATKGGTLPKNATTEDRYEASSAFKGQVDRVAGLQCEPCMVRPWCWHCNGWVIAGAAAGSLSKDQLMSDRGGVSFTPEMRAAIETLPPGTAFCSAVHAEEKVGSDGGEVSRRATHKAVRVMCAMGVNTPCPREGCNLWIRPNSCHPVFHCECGQPFGNIVSDKELLRPVVKERVRTTHERESRFHLLGAAVGKYALEEDGRVVIKSLADVQRALVECRENPYFFKAVQLELEITRRIVAFGPLWQTGSRGKGLVVLDGQLPERDITRGMEGFACDKLYEGAAGMEEPAFNRLAPDEPLNDEDRPGHRALISYLINCYERLLKMFAYCNKSAHLVQVAPAVQALQAEFLAARGRQWHWRTVAKALQCLLDDNSQRFQDATRFPNINQLTHAEKEAGGILTFLPWLGCTTMLREIWVAQEEAQFSATERHLLDRSKDADKHLRREVPKQGQAAPDKQAKEIAKLKAEVVKLRARKEGGKPKAEGEPKAKGEPKTPQERKDLMAVATCGHCKLVGHYKRDCPHAHLEKVKKSKFAKPKKAEDEEVAERAEKAKGLPKKEATSSSSSSHSDEPSEGTDSDGEHSGEDSEGHQEDEYPTTGPKELVAKGYPVQDVQLMQQRGDDDSGSRIAYGKGELYGNAEAAARKLLLTQLPRDEDGVEICYDFQTGDCQRTDCPLRHKVWPLRKWSASWQLHFTLKGGHCQEQGGVPLNRILSLLDTDQQQQLLQLKGDARRSLALHYYQSRLSNLQNPTSEVMAYGPIQEGETTLHRKILWEAENGGIPACPSLMECEKIFRIMVGNPDALFSGLCFDAGQVIDLPNGDSWNNCCVMKGIAAVLRHRTHYSGAIPAQSMDFVLMKQFLEQMVAIPIDLVRDNPQSELAELYVGTGSFSLDGLPDNALKMTDPGIIASNHVCHISRNPKTGVISANLNCVDVNVHKTGTYNYSSDNWAALWNPKGNGLRFSAAAKSHPVVFTITDGLVAEWRHCGGLVVDKGYTFLEVVRKLAIMAKAGKATIIFSERGQPQKLAQRRARVKKFTQRAILEAQTKLRAFLAQAEEGILEEEGEAQPALRAKGNPPASKPTQLELHEAEVMAPATTISKESKQKEKAKWNAEHDAWLAQNLEGQSLGWVWQQDKSSSPTGNGRQRLKIYTEVYLPELQRLKAEDKIKEGVHYAARFFGDWLLELLKVHSPGEAKDLMVEVWRDYYFEGRASGGLRADSARCQQMLKAGLSEEHVALITEFYEKGADPIYIELRPKGAPWPENKLDGDEAERLVHIAQLDDAITLKQMVFDFADEAKIWEALKSEGMLEEAGLSVCSLVIAGKSNPDGSPKMTGNPPEQAQRICVNGSIKGGFNEGISTGDHTRQKTTSPARVVLKACMEEKKAPQHQVRVTKLDLKAAFTVLGHIARRVGLFCYAAGDYLSMCLVMIFGAKSSPGLFEPVGDAVLQCLVADSRPPDAKEGQEIGDTHPEMGRFVDDLASMIAMFGNRCEDHMNRLKGIVLELLGPDGISMDKMEEEGAPTNFKHIFGVVIDMTRRLVAAPWSKLVKVHGLAGKFAEGKAPQPDAGETLSIRGLLQFALQCAPGMGRWVLPRLNVADAEISRYREKHPENWKDHLPSFAFKGETPEQGLEMLRRGLALILRLAALKKGRLLQCSFEALLPPHIRKACPGKEGEECFVNIIMDSSGAKLYAQDESDGAQLQYTFSEAEQALFNHYEEGVHAVTINHRETLTEVFVAVKMGPKHVGKLVTLTNDNTAAESWTRSSKHDHARVDQILGVMGIFETVFKCRFWGDRVKSEDNFADLPTRSELHEKYKEELAEREKKFGWTASWVELDQDTVEMGWGQLHQNLPEQDWYIHAGKMLENAEKEFPGVAEKACGVSLALILEALRSAAQGLPLPDVFVADGDFVEKVKSKERLELTQGKAVTENILQRELAAKQKSLGVREGARAFNKRLRPEGDLEEDPQATIGRVLQENYSHAWDVLGVLNRDYDPTKSSSRPPPPAVVPLTLPEGYRPPVNGHLTGASFYSGVGSLDTSWKETGYVEVVGHSERDPEQRAFLEGRFPQARSFSSVEEHWDSELVAAMLTAGAPCTQHAAANQFKAGNQANYGGKEFQEFGLLVEEKQPTSAHVECTIGAQDSTGGMPSPLEELAKNTPSYFMSVLVLKAGHTVSPLTGEVAPLSHERLHVLLFRKADHVSPPVVEIAQLEGRPPTAAHIGDEAHEALEYRTMPDADVASVDFKPARISEHGASYGTVFDPTQGNRGYMFFPNMLEDGELGPLSTVTSEGGSKWGPRELNGRARVTMRTNVETARAYLAVHRQLQGSKLLEGRSRTGQKSIGGMIPMNISDAIACLMVLVNLRIQEDGLTAHEKWLGSAEQLFAKGRPSEGGQVQGGSVPQGEPQGSASPPLCSPCGSGSASSSRKGPTSQSLGADGSGVAPPQSEEEQGGSSGPPAPPSSAGNRGMKRKDVPETVAAAAGEQDLCCDLPGCNLKRWTGYDFCTRTHGRMSKQQAARKLPHIEWRRQDKAARELERELAARKVRRVAQEASREVPWSQPCHHRSTYFVWCDQRCDPDQKLCNLPPTGEALPYQGGGRPCRVAGCPIVCGPGQTYCNVQSASERERRRSVAHSETEGHVHGRLCSSPGCQELCGPGQNYGDYEVYCSAAHDPSSAEYKSLGQRLKSATRKAIRKFMRIASMERRLSPAAEAQMDVLSAQERLEEVQDLRATYVEQPADALDLNTIISWDDKRAVANRVLNMDVQKAEELRAQEAREWDRQQAGVIRWRQQWFISKEICEDPGCQHPCLPGQRFCGTAPSALDGSRCADKRRIAGAPHMQQDRQMEVWEADEAWVQWEDNPVDPDDMDTWTNGGLRISVNELLELYQARLAKLSPEGRDENLVARNEHAKTDSGRTRSEPELDEYMASAPFIGWCIARHPADDDPLEDEKTLEQRAHWVKWELKDDKVNKVHFNPETGVWVNGGAYAKDCWMRKVTPTGVTPAPSQKDSDSSETEEEEQEETLALADEQAEKNDNRGTSSPEAEPGTGTYNYYSDCVDSPSRSSEGDPPAERMSTPDQKDVTAEPSQFAKGRKRIPVRLSPELEARNLRTQLLVMKSGMKPATRKAYNAGFDHWKQVAEAKGWGIWLDTVEMEERQKRVLWWLAYEKSEYNLKARSLRAKKSAVRWQHIASLHQDPFEGCLTVNAWLANLEKVDGPASPKIPVVITMLKMIGVLLDPDNLDHVALKAAMVSGFWFCLRSIEYLADDSGVFDPDRSLVWGDITGRDERGELLAMAEWITRMTDMSYKLFSAKNTLETCTRTVYENSGQGPEARAELTALKAALGEQCLLEEEELSELVCVCPVKAIKKLLQAFLKHKGRLPRPDEAVFAKTDGSVWTRGEVSEWLKQGAEACNIPRARVASHSLRRGGASAYVAAGLSDAHIERFGRWTSTAYKAYVYQHAEAIKAALITAAVQVPRFEMN